MNNEEEKNPESGDSPEEPQNNQDIPPRGPAEQAPKEEKPKPAEPPVQSHPQPAATPPGGDAESIVSKPITRITPAQPVAPEQPPAKTTAAEPVDRRTFIKWLTIGWGAFAAIMAGYGTLLLRFMFPNVLFEPKQSFRAGFPEDFEIGKVSERFKNKHGVWIVRDSERIYALSTVCTHLGCTPNWLDNENKFKCPCHGSGFYKTGINFEGPAPRPLERFKISVSDEGELIIDKTKKFQQEKGEWKDPESYLTV